MKTRRRVLEKLRLSEISGVDRPCQEHARVVIMKRAMPASGATGDQKETMMTTENSEETVAELEAQVSDLEASIDDLNKQLDAALAGGGGGEGDSKDANGRKRLSKAAANVDELAKLKEQVAGLLEQNAAVEKIATALGSLSAPEMDFYKALSSDEKKKKFLEMKQEERDKEMKDYAKADESVTISGRTIKKSVVGEDAFAIMKAQADEIAKAQTDIAKERQKREDAELRKRADDNFPHVPGTVDERAAMLGALGKMDEPLRKNFEAVFEQSEKLAKAGFDKLGHTGKNGKPGGDTEIVKAAQKFDSLVEKARVDLTISRTEAMAKVRRENADLFKAYQEVEASSAN